MTITESSDGRTDRDVVDILTDDHQEMIELLERLKDSPDPKLRRELSDTVTAEVMRHSVAEEMFVYPAMEAHLPGGSQMRTHIPAETLRELGEKVQTAKKAAPTRSHPHAPHSELFHKVVGPGVGMVDRLRDRLTGRQSQ